MIEKISPILLKDFYKTGHVFQYPKGTEYIYSNLTPRGSRVTGVDSMVVFGIQYFIQEYLINRFNDGFFKVPKDAAIAAYKRRMDNALGPDSISTEHLEKLHDLGYLPLVIKALPEGSLCKFRVPMLTIVNTHPDFFWLTNFLETVLCNVIWGMSTSATTAYEYRRILTRYAKETSDMEGFVQWQGHDFSMRGMFGIEAALISGAAHLLSFTGTDTVPAIDFLEMYYGANAEKELIGGSVPATEHSVMCLGGVETEYETYNRLLTKVYPKGIVSVVSDTWDYWKVLTETIPSLKSEIMARDGKLVVRPDSGVPELIICGDPSAPEGSPQHKGSIELLWETFGGTVNSKGYKQLDSHIGLIYGDSITMSRCLTICEQLKRKGFASTNVVLGIGSYTYQYVTRDTYGFAMKATYGIIDGKPVEIFKQPKTDNGIKNSAKGLLKVEEDGTLKECCTQAEEAQGLLQPVFENGKAVNITTLAEIRSRISKNLAKEV
jgi:nicotinamide phosphoribosyltransferase